MARADIRREEVIERYLLRRCRESGFLCLKFVSPARGGVPDRLVITPAGTVFVEVKRPGSHLDRRQRLMHAKLRRFGGKVHVVDNKAAVDEFVTHLRGGGSAQSDRQN